MKRFLLAFFVLSVASVDANAASLLSVTLTAAVSPAAVGPTYQVRDLTAAKNLTAEAIFTYGSGGTSADAYLQTTFDGGDTWVDVTNFHFTTASASKVVNLSSMTPVTTAVTPTDGSMTANTAQDGVLGSQFRVKYASAGTYAGGTTLKVNVFSNVRLVTSP